MKSECRGYFYNTTLLSVLLAAILSLVGCTNPEKAKAEHVAKGDAYLKETKFQEASLEFRNALQIDDKFAAAHWGLAQAYEGMQRFPEMMDELRKTVELDANNIDARIRLGNYYIAGSRGNPQVIDMADKLADEVLQKDQNNVEGHILKGTVYFAKKDTDSAAVELKKAIDLDPTRVESYISLAKFYIVMNQPAKAEETFNQAISVNGSSPVAHTEYGKFLVQTNRPVEAEAELVKAVEVGPNDHTARFVLASFYLVNKKLDKAEEAYKALAALDKDKPEGEAVLADFYSSVNRLDDAIRIYQQILAKAPDYMQGHYRLAEILSIRGDVQGANAQIDIALKKDAHDRQALLLRARLRAVNGEPDSLKAAVEDLKDVLSQEPNSRLGLYFMAQANFGLGLIDQARAFAGDLERNYPDFLPAKLLQVQINLASGDAKTALTLANDLLARLEKAAPDATTSPQMLAEVRERTYLARGMAQLRLNNPTAARQNFEDARTAAPNDPAVYNNLALVSLVENKNDDAIAQFENALKLDGSNFAALNGVITVYIKAQEFDKAFARIDQALASYPNNASLHYIKAQIHGSQRNAQGAEAELNKALELDPNYIAAYSSLGALFINTKQEDRAIAEYKKILEKRPDDAVAYTLIGMLEDSRKNYDAAADSYRQALQKDPNAMIAANNLAWLYAVAGKGNLDEAVRLAQGVVQKNPNVAGFADTLGWVYYKKELYAAAAEQLKKAVTLDEAAAKANNASPSATYHYHLGMALKSKGDKEGSRRELEEALRLGDKAPFADADEAKKALATL